MQRGALLKKKSSGINYAKPADTMITCTLMHCMQAGQAGRFGPEASSKLTTKRMDAWTAGRPAVREYLGARRIHAACFSLRASSRPALHFCDTVTAAWMQGNLLLLTDKVVWYSTQHSTVQYVRVLTLQPWAGRVRN